MESVPTWNEDEATRIADQSSKLSVPDGKEECSEDR
jgi:hypothetical protein